ncbi:tail assembly protein [Streptococcus phage Javan202]|nr:tail assembly protein [Streptococcus phage Javan202]
MNLAEKAIDRTEVTFWHGLSATKHPLGVYDCGGRDHSWANEFNVTSGKTYTVRVIAKQTKGSIRLAGGIWYTAMTSGHAYDSYAPFTLVGETSEDGLGIYERKLVVASGKTKAKIYIQLEQTAGGGYSTAWRIYDGQVFDENGQPLVTDQNNFGALTSPMAAPDGTYIWKRTITYYTDGTNSTVWEYSGVGSKGTDGTNGQTSHVHFAFADNATGGGFSLTTPKAYMGWYADFNETASNDPTKYKWGKWKGDQGLPGKPGADGKTSYFHMAYADSADGKTGFSFTESGQQYQGYYTDFTQTSSTDPTKYTWMDRRAGVEVGGVNLLRNSKSFTGSNISGSAKLLTETYNGCAVRYLKTSAWGEIAQFSKCVVPEVNSTYVASFWAKGNGKIRAYFYGDPNYLPVLSGISNQNAVTSAGDGAIDFTVTEEWKRYWVTYKLKSSFPTTDTTVAKHFLLRHLSSTAEEEFWVAGYKLEEGNVPTPYTRNPDDIQSDIDSKADQALTQQQLNALAEQNSIVKAEMEAKASIDTVNQWITAYQNYVNANDEAKAESERNLQEASARILQLKTDVGTLRQQWDFIDTYMTVQNEGLIIGKSDGSAYAKFANDRISLFSGSSEVMYISQGVLRIENGIFTKTIQIGRFRFETHPADQDMLVLRYLGG